jgi:hypothetical protein
MLCLSASKTEAFVDNRAIHEACAEKHPAVIGAAFPASRLGSKSCLRESICEIGAD